MVFHGVSLESEGTLFRVPDKILGALELLDGLSSAGDVGVQVGRLVFLIGTCHARTGDFDKAGATLRKELALLDPVSSSVDAGGTLQGAAAQLDRAYIHLRIGFVDGESGNVESASSSLKEAIQTLNSMAAHPIISGKGGAEGDPKRADPGGSGDGGPPLSEPQRQELEMARKNGLASALHRLGQAYVGRGRSEKAVKCFEDAAVVLNEIQDLRAESRDWRAAPLPPVSRCFWEEISVASTSVILSDANERSGRISADGRFSFQCFERAIGMREFITTTAGSLAGVDTQGSLECFEESNWDGRNMDCYSAMLMLIEKRELARGKKSRRGEEKSWKIYDKAGLDPDTDSEDGPGDEGDEWLLTKEDVLFRIGNLQVKLGRLKDAIRSYREAEELTIARLGTKNHAIVMNMNHNMGNAYRAISVSSTSKESRSAKESAVACYSESVRISHAVFGKQHVTSAESLQNLAVLHMRAGNAWLDVLNGEQGDDNGDELAYKTFKESLSIRRREKGSQNDLETAFILHRLGDLCLRKIGYYYRCDDAEALSFRTTLSLARLLCGPVDVGCPRDTRGIAHGRKRIAKGCDVLLILLVDGRHCRHGASIAYN